MNVTSLYIYLLFILYYFTYYKTFFNIKEQYLHMDDTTIYGRVFKWQNWKKTILKL